MYTQHRSQSALGWIMSSLTAPGWIRTSHSLICLSDRKQEASGMADNGPHHLPHRNPPRTSDQPPHAQLAAAGIAATHGTRRDTGLLRPTRTDNCTVE
jgi:hypothetical protein